MLCKLSLTPYYPIAKEKICDYHQAHIRFTTQKVKKEEKEAKMNILINKTPKYTEVALSGSLDAVTSPDAEVKLMAAVNEASAMVIDFSDLSYISSAGLRVMLGLAKAMQKKDGKLVISSLSPQVKEVFDISGFTAIFRIFDTKADAISVL